MVAASQGAQPVAIWISRNGIFPLRKKDLTESPISASSCAQYSQYILETENIDIDPQTFLVQIKTDYMTDFNAS
jgi:hypothetical protein